MGAFGTLTGGRLLSAGRRVSCSSGSPRTPAGRADRGETSRRPVSQPRSLFSPPQDGQFSLTLLYNLSPHFRYKLGNRSRWPAEGTFDFEVLRDLDNFLQRPGGQSRGPSVHTSFPLREQPSLCSCLRSLSPNRNPLTLLPLNKTPLKLPSPKKLPSSALTTSRLSLPPPCAAGQLAPGGPPPAQRPRRSPGP